MPDIWTKHPDIVRDLLKEAGFTCGVKPRFLESRDPAWTCAFDGQRMKGDLYVHHVAALRGERRSDADPPGATPAAAGDWSAPAVAMALAAVLAARRLRRRRRRARAADAGSC